MKAALALNPPRIWRIKLPKVFSLSWLDSLVADSNSTADFRALLRHFAPALYRKARPATQLKAYEHLLKWLAERAPIDDAGALDWDMEILQDGGDLGEGGIPIILHGYDNYETQSPARDLLMRWLNKNGYSEGAFTSLNSLLKNLPPDPQNLHHLDAPPAGRRWIKPWDGLGSFAQWITASTGWDILDLSYEDVGDFPPWNVDEVQALIDMWAQCQPIYERLTNFNRWVDENPDERLRPMVLAVAGDAETLHAISEPIL